MGNNWENIEDRLRFFSKIHPDALPVERIHCVLFLYGQVLAHDFVKRFDKLLNDWQAQHKLLTQQGPAVRAGKRHKRDRQALAQKLGRMVVRRFPKDHVVKKSGQYRLFK